MPTLEELGFKRMLRIRGRDLKVLSGSGAGGNFTGTINRIGSFDLNTDLGNDPRGKRILETAATGCPGLAAQDKLQDVKNNEVYRVVTIGLDSPDYSKKFLLQQDVKDVDQ